MAQPQTQSLSLKPRYNSRPLLILLISFLVTLCIHTLKTSNLEWEIVSIKTITQSDVVSYNFLLIYRWLSTILVLGTALWSFFDPQGLNIETKYLPESSLPITSILLKGKTRCATFTVWCWYLIGLYFLLTSIVSTQILFQPSSSSTTPNWLLHIIWVLYEVAFGCSILVTVVVTFILLPLRAKHVLKDGQSEYMLKTRPIIMHNLNVFLMFTELSINNLPIKFKHIPFTVLWGCLYCIFAWIWHAKTGVYFYPFLDHTLRWWKALSFHLGLIIALVGFHCLGVMTTSWFSLETYPIGTRLIMVYTLVAMITKVR